MFCRRCVYVRRDSIMRSMELAYWTISPRRRTLGRAISLINWKSGYLSMYAQKSQLIYIAFECQFDISKQ
jgi:hypothetical protein